MHEHEQPSPDVSAHSHIVSDVAGHYNARPDEGLETRLGSKILRLKNFNNWTKSVLIGHFAANVCNPQGSSRSAGMYVLDLCCGKGGDLLKWANAGAHCVVLADVAHTSVLQALERINSRRNCRFAAIAFACDCCQVKFVDELDCCFDMVSCQFALHYSFESEDRARVLMYNISARLLPGGCFVATIPDANVLVQKLRHAFQSTGQLEFGNELYRVRFQSADFPRSSPFGTRYEFFLHDAVENVPEYLVPLETLRSLAQEFGLTLEWHKNFHQIYAEFGNVPEYRKLLRYLMTKFDAPGSQFSPEEWDIAYLYMAVVFRKTAGSVPHCSPRPHGAPQHREYSPQEVRVR